MAEVMQVVLADNHPLVCAGICATLATAPDVLVVREAANGYDVQHLCRDLLPHVLLLDLSMPGPPPPQLIADLREYCPTVRVRILTAYDDAAYFDGILAARVVGYLLKDQVLETIVDAIRTVMEGDTWFVRLTTTKLAHQRPDAPLLTPNISPTPRERQILEWLARGFDNPRIASDCQFQKQTIRAYTSRIYTKLEVHWCVEALVWARQQGLLVGKPLSCPSMRRHHEHQNKNRFRYTEDPYGDDQHEAQPAPVFACVGRCCKCHGPRGVYE